ncbi:LPS-assembly protein LptD [bacterium]|nr:LPS-assembly protein LptD [bacterium]
MRKDFVSLWIFALAVFSITTYALEFKAQFYQRDNSRNTIKGRGAAWVKKDGRQIWADELEIDLNLNRVFASGNVHIQEGPLDIFASGGTYALEGAEGTLDDVTLIFGQTVIYGATLNQVAQNQFELLDGFYTNCNTVPYVDKDANKCPFDVKIYGSRFFLTLDSYVHIHDAIVYAKELPLLYTPYFIAPAKTKRQSGILVPQANFRERIGTGFSLPLFLALGSWHDLTITPTFWSRAGFHTGLDYRYVYSAQKKGRMRIFLLEQSFNSDPTIAWIRVPGRRYLGLFSEVGVEAHNEFALSGRSHFRQDIHWVTNNYWNQDFPMDFGPLGDFQYFRNQVSFTAPGDSYLTTAAVKLNQSLVNTQDVGADSGSVAQLPELRFYRKTLSTFIPHTYFEWDNRFTNFSRPKSDFDNIPDQRVINGSNALEADTNPGFDTNDFLRTGQRLIMERRLVGNAPLAPGFQFQPVLKAGLLAYHFPLPNSIFKNQTYVDTEIPFSLYLSRTYSNESSQSESIRHIIQPRILYGGSLYKSKVPDHPFFAQAPPPAFTSPRFDALDDNAPYEYFRFEFNNRLMRKTALGTERFLLAQLSNNYFLKPSLLNNGAAGLGPLEAYLDLRIGQISAQIQGTYQLTPTNDVHENDWSGTLAYANPYGDKVSIATLIRKKANPVNNDETLVLSVYKPLPIYLDVFASIEHSFRQSITRNYQIGFLFAAKPRNCWSLSFLSGRTVQNEHYARLVFGLSFGKV